MESVFGLGSRRPVLTWTLAAIVACIGAFAAYTLHHACTHSAEVFPRPPEPGTPRSGYCAAVAGSHPWLQLILLPALLILGVGYASRHRPAFLYAVAAVVIASVLGMAVVPENLDYIRPLHA